jgi:hypothetical protein
VASDKIKAYYRQEERYIGLSLEFCDGDDCCRLDILKSIEELKEEMKMYPDVFENDKKTSVYIEFGDDYDKESGEFFEALLKKLDIQKCEDCDI